MVARLMVVEDDHAALDLLREELDDAGHDVTACASAEEAMACLSQADIDLIITDVRLPGLSGMELLTQLRQHDRATGVIVITAFGTIEQAVEALKFGADDFLTKPLDLDAVHDSIFRVLERRRHASGQPGDAAPGPRDFHGIIGESDVMQRLFHDVSRLADSDAAILLQGESGTGKELLARAIHAESPRAEGPFVAVNCASVPAELMESEFFGHAKGAFTGAHEARVGLFQSAGGGSLFLDEIGEMSPELQAKLLRALQEKRIRPVGGEREKAVDVRIIAATHCNLEDAIERGGFRSDLFYRLETFSLHVPPLRERHGDLQRLIDALIDKHAQAQDKPIERIEPEALEALLGYAYPGNVRELENAIMRAVTLAEDGELRHEGLPERLRRHPPTRQLATSHPLPGEEAAWPRLEDVERRYIRKVLEATGGNKRRTAEILGIGRKTLYRRLDDTPSST